MGSAYLKKCRKAVVLVDPVVRHIPCSCHGGSPLSMLNRVWIPELYIVNVSAYARYICEIGSAYLKKCLTRL